MHLYFVGYRGSGKSTVARRLAERIGRDWVDTDDLVEMEAGCSIAEIFASEGEQAFRERESEVIRRLSFGPAHVISLGGGAVLSEENRRLIGVSGQVVWLDASADVLLARITDDATSSARRPSLTDQPMDQEVRDLIARREPFYREVSDLRIDTSDASVDAIVDRVADWLASLET